MFKLQLILWRIMDILVFHANGHIDSDEAIKRIWKQVERL